MQARTLTSTPSASPVRIPETGVVLYYDPPVYPHTSTFRSRHIELNIRSPSIEHVEDPKFIGQSIPVFYGKDSVGGSVITTIPAVILAEHHLTISIEGAFFWIAPQKEEPQALPLSPPLPKRIKHVFLSSSFSFPLSPSPSDSPLKPSVSIRSVLQDGIRNTLFRRTGLRSRQHTGKTAPQNGSPEDPHVLPDSAKKIHSFSFSLPVIVGRRIPSTISVSRLCPGGIRGRWYAEGAQIAYKLTAHVYPVATREEDTEILEEQLEAPIFIESSDSSDIREQYSGSWSHSTLACLKNLPFHCKLALPQRASFSRSDAITFYVVFSTLPKSEALARRIVNGASIRVSLIRQLRLDPGITIPAPIPATRHSDKTQRTKRRRERSSSQPNLAESRLPKIFTWQKKPTEPVWPDSQNSASRTQVKSPLIKDKPLPPLPSESSNVYEHVICSVVADGFPKRVTPKDPSLSFESSSGPEGIFRGQLRLSNELSNTIDWPGISLSYFVEASVHFENDVVRTRDRVRLVEAYT